MALRIGRTAVVIKNKTEPQKQNIYDKLPIYNLTCLSENPARKVDKSIK
jgi:hypothetical protein